MTDSSTFDPLVLETFWSRLISTVEQQAVALIRTSFTPSVAECGDLSACVFDPRGYMLAQAVTGTPGHINSMARCIMHVLAEYPAETLERGDVIITNDPWLTSGHHYDVTIVTPIFRGETLVAFFGNICHTADIGGRPYGPDAMDVYEEGLHIPILKLFQRGQPNADLFKIVRTNVRSPEEVIGDFYSQVAGDAVGGQRLLEFMDEYGLDSIVPLADRHRRLRRADSPGARDHGRWRSPGGRLRRHLAAGQAGDQRGLQLHRGVHHLRAQGRSGARRAQQRGQLPRGDSARAGGKRA